MDWATVIHACGAFVKDNGFAAFFTCLILFVGYRVGMTFVREVAKPASERFLNIADNVNRRHDDFITSTLASQGKIETCIDAQGVCINKLEENSATHTQILQNHSAILGQIHEQTKVKRNAGRKA